MSNNDSLKHLNVTIKVRCVKDKDKNPVAEKAVRELEDELTRQEPGGRPVSKVGLAIATARLNPLIVSQILGNESSKIYGVEKYHPMC